MNIYLLYDKINCEWWCDLDGLWDKRDAQREADSKTENSDGEEEWEVVAFTQKDEK